jgi:hypothetical protein
VAFVATAEPGGEPDTRATLDPGPDATVGTLVVDTGLKYLSTEVYRSGT